MNNIAPGLLIAVPQLQDPNFDHTVVLMLEHSEEGSLGLVINRESRLTFAELARTQEMPVAESHANERVHVGGPAEPFRGFVLHDRPASKESSEVLPGLYLTVASSVAKPLLLDESARLLFCLGCSGWGPGQLEREFKEGSWLFAEVSAEFVLTKEPRKMWQEVLNQMGIDPSRMVKTTGLN